MDYSPPRLRQFLSTYRWELALLFGLPITAGLVIHPAWWGAVWLSFCSDGQTCYSWVSLSFNVSILAFLAASYPFVRRQQRGLLTLLWELEIVESVLRLAFGVGNTIGVNASLINAELFSFEIEFQTPTGPTSSSGTSAMLDYSATQALYLAARLWFTRKASRISLPHAFLLYALSLADQRFGFVLGAPVFLWYDPDAVLIAIAAVYLTTQIGVNIIAFRLLTEHEKRGPEFRLVGAGVMLTAFLLSSLLSWASFYGTLVERITENWYFPGLPAVEVLDSIIDYVPGLVLVYFVRVRTPTKREPDATSFEDAVGLP